MSRLLVLIGHPRPSSFCAALAHRYAEAACEAGHEVNVIALSDIAMDPSPPDYAAAKAPQEKWVTDLQRAIAWSEHFVVVTPLWWGGMPGALKSLFDRVLLPGFAFRYRSRGLGWDKLLAGRSARVIVTADTPPSYFRWVLGQPLFHQIRRQILGFCGFSPVRTTLFGPIRTASEQKRAAWLDRAAALGQEAA